MLISYSPKIDALLKRPSITIPGSNKSFLELPLELQYMVYGFCDMPSFWALMRTTSAIRAGASKLFWSVKSIRYVFDIDESLR